MSVRHTQRFLKLYFLPFSGVISYYLLLFIFISVLSFATLVRDFVSLPFLILQFLSPLVAIIGLYILPPAAVSAGVFSYYASKQTSEDDDNAILEVISKRLLVANSLTNVILTILFVATFSYQTNYFDTGTSGLIAGAMSIIGLIAAMSSGGYAANVARNALKPASGKRKFKHELKDKLDTGEIEAVSVNDNQMEQQDTKS